MLHQLIALHKAFTILLLLVHSISCKDKQANEQTTKQFRPSTERNNFGYANPKKIDPISSSATTEAPDFDQCPKFSSTGNKKPKVDDLQSKNSVEKKVQNSQKTQNQEKSTMSVINDEANNDHQSEPSTQEAIQTVNSKAIDENNSLSKDEPDGATAIKEELRSKPIEVDEPTFSLEKEEAAVTSITIKVGIKESITLKAVGKIEGYVVKSISVSQGEEQNKKYFTKKFLEDKHKEAFQGKLIQSSGFIDIPLMADPSLKAGDYLLNIKVGQKGRGSRSTEKWIPLTIHVIKGAKK